jgi:hypothetical protein
LLLLLLLNAAQQVSVSSGRTVFKTKAHSRYVITYMSPGTRGARFFLVQHTKTWKILTMTPKYMYRKAVKYTYP